jgi:hypothetical protein
MLRPLFPTWYACAKKLGDVELTVKLLVEMLGYGDIDEPGTLQEDLLTLLKVRYDLRAGQNATGSQSLDVCTHFIECHFGR